MCWRKKVEPITGNKLALLFGINNYPGTGSDLSGCLNDIDDVEKKLKSEFPDFQIKKFKDSEVTTGRFVSEIEAAFASIPEGILYIHYSGHGCQIPSATEPDNYNEALYLVNGPLLDDIIYSLQQKTPDKLLVDAKFDSCFSGGMNSRNHKSHIKNRFFQIPGVPIMRKPVNRFAKTDANQKWVIWAGSGEGQTSADAWFGGRANGAFTYFDNKAYDKNTIRHNELEKCGISLLSNGFDQVPEISGPSERLTKIVFT